MEVLDRLDLMDQTALLLQIHQLAQILQEVAAEEHLVQEVAEEPEDPYILKPLR